MVTDGCWISGGGGGEGGGGPNIPVVKLSIFYPGYQRFCSRAAGIFGVGIFSQYSKKPLESLITCSMKG